MTSMDHGNRGWDRRWAAVLLFCTVAGCWESAVPGGGDIADGDGGTEGTDSLVGWSCSDLSPCVQSTSSGFSCPGFASGVHCWNLGSECDAVFLCASTSQACEIICGATTCEASGTTPPQPLCD
jgi:hypothetical protein